jgi:hypothetical protein
MKKLFAVSVLSILVGLTATLAQDAPAPAQPGQNRRASRNDPHIVPPRATPNLQPPNAPPLPYHFVTQPAPMPGQKFGNVSGVALRDADGATSNLIGEAHYLVVTPDQKTIYIADTVNAKVLKLEHD